MTAYLSHASKSLIYGELSGLHLEAILAYIEDNPGRT